MTLCATASAFLWTEILARSGVYMHNLLSVLLLCAVELVSAADFEGPSAGQPSWTYFQT